MDVTFGAVPGLGDALAMLAKAVVVGPVLAFLFETAPFISVWFQGLASNAKWWIVFLLSLALPLIGQLAVEFVPPGAITIMEPYWQALAFGFVAWAGTQGTHLVQKRLNGS